MLKTLDAERFTKPSSELNPGPATQLQWTDVSKLVVDHTYQRQIGRRGAQNVHQIAELDAAGVTIVRTNIVASKMKPGQTNAVIRIEKCVEQYGKDVMIATLRCLTKTADGNAGFLRATRQLPKCLTNTQTGWATKQYFIVRSKAGAGPTSGDKSSVTSRMFSTHRPDYAGKST